MIMGRVLLVVEHIADIKVQGISVCSGFLGTVEHGNAFHGFREYIEEIFFREGTVEVNGDQDRLSLPFPRDDQ